MRRRLTDSIVHGATCDGCERYPLRSDRFKCLECHNFDLCARCFEKRQNIGNHHPGHGIVHLYEPNELFGQTISIPDLTLNYLEKLLENEVNPSITCDGCDRKDFIGLRFKCDMCEDYDLCHQCFLEKKITRCHGSHHPMVLTSHRLLIEIHPNDIQIGERLGSGGFGQVHKAWWKRKNRPVACKMIEINKTKWNTTEERSVFTELRASTEIYGGYILRTFGYTVQDKGNVRIYGIITELMERGSLTDLLKSEKKLSLRRKLHIAHQVATGMRKIHDHRMIHRDIRPDNILINEHYRAKIADMGIALFNESNLEDRPLGCKIYMPPEYRDGIVTEALDIFTFGVTLNQLFAVKPLENRHELLAVLSPVFTTLIQRCTDPDPSKRPTAKEIETMLETFIEAFYAIVLAETPDYAQLSREEKDDLFMQFYRETYQSVRNEVK